MNTHMNKKSVYIGIAVLAVILIIAIAFTGQGGSSSSATASSTGRYRVASATSSVVVTATSTLFNASAGNFSLILPKGWEVKQTLISSTTPWVATTYFAPVADTAATPNVDISVTRFDMIYPDLKGVKGISTLKAVVTASGTPGLSSFIIDQNQKIDTQYVVAATTKLSFGSHDYVESDASYLSPENHTPLAENMFVTVVGDAYYIVRIEGYDTDYQKVKDAAVASVKTLEIEN
jgi:hypothetical protein